MFITLTRHEFNDPVYVNPNFIVAITQGNEYTMIWVAGEHDDPFYVLESAEQIMEKIKEGKPIYTSLRRDPVPDSEESKEVHRQQMENLEAALRKLTGREKKP